jgi:hypothetical protein
MVFPVYIAMLQGRFLQVLPGGLFVVVSDNKLFSSTRLKAKQSCKYAPGVFLF